MTLFVGGPYDGKDLPFDPYKIKRVPLPPGEAPTVSEDLTQTADEDWNCIYKADVSTSPPVYRYQAAE